LAAGPAVLFLSGATAWTAWVFYRFHRQVGSPGAAVLGGALFLWALHHLDYPFLRARGVWNPWGYYLDVFFVLAVGAGILLLVLEDLRRGLAALSDLSGDLQQGEREGDVLARLLERPLTLPGVRGTAMYLAPEGRWVRGAGLCAAWAGREPAGAPARVVGRAMRSGHPVVVRDGASGVAEAAYAYAAALPVLRGSAVTGAMLIVGDTRDPFAALDERFLVALGRQVGAALESVDLTRRLEARTRELERLAGRMVQQQEEERRRLSRELHDETAQVFSSVKLQLGVLRERVDTPTAERLDHALSLMDTGIRGIRDLTNALRPALLDDLGLVPALRAIVARFGEQGDIETRFEPPPTLPPLSDEAEVALFRSLQEALANVARHADATTVAVRVAVEDGHVAVRVRDDGKGVDDETVAQAEREGRMGLAGMRERIAALGGDVVVDGTGGGTTVVVRLPATEGAA
ncbi:MAG: GAF domain-containing sensor histidine kinase, partial [Gemmatimonadales bacterium]